MWGHYDEKKNLLEKGWYGVNIDDTKTHIYKQIPSKGKGFDCCSFSQSHS